MTREDFISQLEKAEAVFIKDDPKYYEDLLLISDGKHAPIFQLDENDTLFVFQHPTPYSVTDILTIIPSPYEAEVVLKFARGTDSLSVDLSDGFLSCIYNGRPYYGSCVYDIGGGDKTKVLDLYRFVVEKNSGINDAPYLLEDGILKICLCEKHFYVLPEEGVQEIDNLAFARSELRHIFLPPSLRIIRRSAFELCEKLDIMWISPGLEVIEDLAFRGCRSLNRLRLPSTVRKIGDYAFSETGLAEVICDDSVRELLENSRGFPKGVVFKSPISPGCRENLPKERNMKAPEKLEWLKESGISDETIRRFSQKFDFDPFTLGNILVTLIDNRESCKETILYLKEIGVKDWMIEELFLYQTDIFLMTTSELKTYIRAAALRKFVEDMSENWDEYFNDIFDKLVGYSKPYRDFI